MNLYQKMVLAFFKNSQGQPYLLTQGQSDIFRLVYEPSIKRGAVKAVTQYGKSDVTSIAILLTAIERREKILIVSPSEKQSRIIMSYVIGHIFDDDYLEAMLEYEGSKERLKEERSKQRITFNNGSEIYILTAEAGIVSREAKGLMGFGASIVIVDESALIPDNMYSKILRMIGGVENGKIVQLGNPFQSGHFQRAFTSPRYQSLTIDYHQAIKEGRISADFVQEAREEMSSMDFTIFYDCQFPSGGAEDSLIPYEWIKKAINRNVIGDESQVGVDVARFGRDRSVYIYRRGYEVTRIAENTKVDTMSLVGWLRNLLDEDDPDNIAVDVIGIGAGVCDRLDELGYKVTEVNVGESPDDKDKYFNLRAEVFWSLRELFKKDLIGIPNDSSLVQELTDLRYKYSSEKKIRIEAKEDMKKRIGRSPDKADALALAFFDLTNLGTELIIMEN